MLPFLAGATIVAKNKGPCARERAETFALRPPTTHHQRAVICFHLFRTIAPLFKPSEEVLGIPLIILHFSLSLSFVHLHHSVHTTSISLHSALHVHAYFPVLVQ